MMVPEENVFHHGGPSSLEILQELVGAAESRQGNHFLAAEIGLGEAFMVDEIVNSVDLMREGKDRGS